MKVLIIGDALSQYTINFSAALKRLDPSVGLDIINTRAMSPEASSINSANLYGQVFHHQPMSGFVEKIPKVRVLFRNYKGNKTIQTIKHNIAQYDAILLHGFWKPNCEIYYKLGAEKIFTVGAIWGSDFYRRQNNESLVFKTMDDCDRMVISTQNMVDDVDKVKHIDHAKIRNCLFGLAPLDLLFQMQQISAEESKIKLGFEPDDVIVTCGYNGSSNQQHIPIISSISRITKQLRKKPKILVPMTYGGDSKYHHEVRELLAASGLDYKIYNTFLPDETIAHLRKATDIMLQIQRTDAFSGSMMEHLFSKNIVVTGSWLPYQSLKDKNVYYETIDDLNELDGKLDYVFNHLSALKKKADQSNTSDKFISSLWSECIKDWYNVLKEYTAKSN